ncbi:MAG: OmpA family protein [Burkholderiales bacterium]|nr:OmpA family protein [Burkholderiales bacterium]MDE1928071.1 OmpA family protein [Burkholderiales bacterium]MDE2158527.1 OmpA family protein [Burkholderiales bacterium]MDE2504697.1 OmpA family protein [Burkholderiales bacterium]
MSILGHRITARRTLALWALMLAALAGCGTPQPSVSTHELPFDTAVDQATDALVAQTQKLPGFLARIETKVEAKIAKRDVVLDPMVDAGSGQQTKATQQLEQRVTARMQAKFASLEILPFRADNVAKAAYLLTGTLTRVGGRTTARPLQINLALTDLHSGKVVAQASALAQDQGLDHEPLPYFQDSPVLVKDGVVDGYVRTSATPPGQPADPTYFERLPVATVISDAGSAYNDGHYADALEKYRAAAAMNGGGQLRTLDGIYLSNIKLGRMAEAETAFGNIVAYGFKKRQLDVKFLFNPGSTVFWSDPRVSGAYDMWLRQIARQGAAAQVCMQVIGHTSHTGSEQVNDALSLQRASFILQRLVDDAPGLGPRAKAIGMGWRENIVGSGTDNAVDALDRRVVFKIVDC